MLRPAIEFSLFPLTDCQASHVFNPPARRPSEADLLSLVDLNQANLIGTALVNQQITRLGDPYIADYANP